MSEYTKTFTKTLEEAYKAVKLLNQASTDTYLCAGEGEPVSRSLDFAAYDVFCGRKGAHKANPEFQLQAYMVRTAKNNNWVLPVPGKDWELLDAERVFAGESIPKKLDLLAYSSRSNSYIILELKTNRSLGTAKKELTRYVELLNNEIQGANTVYGKNVPRGGVKGYIVWPEPRGDKRDDSMCDFGIIEFTQGDVLENIRDSSMHFSVHHDPA